MEDLAQGWGRPLQHNDEGRTLEAFIRQIQKSDDALSDADRLGALSVDVQGLGLAGELENNTIKGSTHVWSRDSNASAVCKGSDAMAGEDCHEKVEGILLILVTDGWGWATVAAVIGGERRGSQVRVDSGGGGARGRNGTGI